MYKTKGLPNTRIDVADALRGIAVAGIIIYHAVEHFNIFTSQPISNTLPIDQQVADTLAWLLSGNAIRFEFLYHERQSATKTSVVRLAFLMAYVPPTLFWYRQCSIL